MASNSGVVVIGLGRFGHALALELEAEGDEVLGVDTNEKIIEAHAERLTAAVVADATNEEAMRQLGLHEFRRVVISISTDIEGSILSTLVALRLGVPEIWVKASSKSHAHILNKVGIPQERIVRPEADMGRRVAHLVRGRMIDYIELDDDYAFVRTSAPAIGAGQTLGEAQLRAKYGITVVGVKKHGMPFTYATAETVLERGDQIIISGRRKEVEAFSDLR